MDGVNIHTVKEMRKKVPEKKYFFLKRLPAENIFPVTIFQHFSLSDVIKTIITS